MRNISIMIENSYQCPKCSLEYGSFHDMLIHQMSGHIPPSIQRGPAYCNSCDRFHESFLEDLSHVNCHHNDVQDIDNEGGDGQNVDTSSHHSNSELDADATLCDICGEMYESLLSLMNHEADRHQIGNGRSRDASSSSSKKRKKGSQPTSKEKKKKKNYVSIG